MRKINKETVELSEELSGYVLSGCCSFCASFGALEAFTEWLVVGPGLPVQRQRQRRLLDLIGGEQERFDDPRNSASIVTVVSCVVRD